MAHFKGFEAESLGKIAITLDWCDVAQFTPEPLWAAHLQLRRLLSGETAMPLGQGASFRSIFGVDL